MDDIPNKWTKHGRIFISKFIFLFTICGWSDRLFAWWFRKSSFKSISYYTAQNQKVSTRLFYFHRKHNRNLIVAVFVDHSSVYFLLYRRAKLHPQKQRSKYICKPDAVVEAGNHFVWEFVTGRGSLNVPADAGILHHYRVSDFTHEFAEITDFSEWISLRFCFFSLLYLNPIRYVNLEVMTVSKHRQYWIEPRTNIRIDWWGGLKRFTINWKYHVIWVICRKFQHHHLWQRQNLHHHGLKHSSSAK